MIQVGALLGEGPDRVIEHSRGRRFVVFDDVLGQDAVILSGGPDSRWEDLEQQWSLIDPVVDGSARRRRVTNDLRRRSAELDTIDDLVRAVVSSWGIAVPADASLDFAFWRYGTGEGLSWHDDGADRIAACTLYASRDWRATWGGELELFDVPTDAVPMVAGDVASDLMGSPVNSTAIFPRFDRLVVLRAGTFHRVRPVTAFADGPRDSLTGFLQK